MGRKEDAGVKKAVAAFLRGQDLYEAWVQSGKPTTFKNVQRRAKVAKAARDAADEDESEQPPPTTTTTAPRRKQAAAARSRSKGTASASSKGSTTSQRQPSVSKSTNRTSHQVQTDDATLVS